MIRREQYMQSLRKQMARLFRMGHFHEVAKFHSESESVYWDYVNPQYYASLIELHIYQEVIRQLTGKAKSLHHYCWLIISSIIKGFPHEHIEREMHDKFGDNAQTISQFIHQWSDAHPRSVIVEPLTNRVHLQATFEQLKRKGDSEGYFNEPKMPVFLVPVKWIENVLYSESQQATFIDTRELLNVMPYAISDPPHLNYNLKPDVRENQHFAIVNYEQWQFLKKTFHGIECRRYTPQQNSAGIELWYKKLNFVVIVDDQVRLNNIPMLVQKQETLKAIIKRVKNICFTYELLSFEEFQKQWEIIWQEGGINNILEHVQDKTFRIEGAKKLNFSCDCQECGLIDVETNLILAVSKDPSTSIFREVKQAKALTVKPNCLRCGSRQNLKVCVCNNVYFCSKSCQEECKQHQKECVRMRKEMRLLKKLIDYYEPHKTHMQLSRNEILRKGLVGLKNFGNTCYLNAALQCFLRLYDVTNYFLDNKHLSDLNVINVLGSEGRMACSYAQFVKLYYNTSKRYLEPRNIMQIVAEGTQFSIYTQQDSQEFLNHFIDKLHQDLNRVKKKPQTETIESDGRPDPVVAAESWNNYLSRNNSFFTDNLAGQYRSEIRCPDCGKISITFDPFMSITLQFPREQKEILVQGYYLSSSGEYLKVIAEPNPTMIAGSLLKKLFQEKVQAVYILNKRVIYQWDPKKNVKANIKEKGLLLFYRSGEGKQLNLEIIDRKGNIIAFNRRLYAVNISSKQQLILKIAESLRVPLSKAIKPVDVENYLEFIQKNEVIMLERINGGAAGEAEYPLQPMKLTIQLSLQTQKQVKIDSSNAEYKYREKVKFVRKSRLKIQEMLANFQQPEQLTRENSWYCSQCKQHRLAEKTVRIYRLPNYVILHLKRFNITGNRYRLYGEKVRTPIDLEEFETIEGKQYELVGVVNHTGTLTGGHYTAYVKKAEWMLYNDEQVCRKKVSGDLAYLLFYQKVE